MTHPQEKSALGPFGMPMRPRDDVRARVVEHLRDDEPVLVADGTGP